MKNLRLVGDCVAYTALVWVIFVLILPVNPVEATRASCRPEYVDPGPMTVVASDVLALDRYARLELVRYLSPMDGRAMGLCVLDDQKEYLVNGEPMPAPRVVSHQPECFLESDFNGR